MNIRTLKSYLGGALAGTTLAAMMTLASPAFGQQFDTPAGSQDSAGDPVSARAVFTVGANSITVTLTNLTTNIKDAGQLLSDLFFKAGGLTTGTDGTISPTVASYINVADNGTVSGATGPAVWELTNTGGTYHLNGLVGGQVNTGPADLIIGPAGAGGVYTNANDSIAGNDPHNPFINQTATFVIATGATSGATISDVVFSFGTAPGDNVAVPIPAAVWLFVSGLVGLIGIARRRQPGIMSAPAVTA